MIRDRDERSRSGARITRYDEQIQDSLPAFGDPETVEAVTNHVALYVGKPEFVVHPIESKGVHIDILVVPPHGDRDFITLVTCGMSDCPMHPPEELFEYRFAELMLCLPSSWILRGSDADLVENCWPIRCIEHLARLPHDYTSWLWATHTVPNGSPPARFAPNTDLCGVVLLMPMLFEEGFTELRVHDDKVVHFHSVVPIYQEEMDLALDEGVEALYDRFAEYDVTEYLDINRPNVAREPGDGDSEAEA